MISYQNVISSLYCTNENIFPNHCCNTLLGTCSFLTLMESFLTQVFITAVCCWTSTFFLLIVQNKAFCCESDSREVENVESHCCVSREGQWYLVCVPAVARRLKHLYFLMIFWKKCQKCPNLNFHLIFMIFTFFVKTHKVKPVFILYCGT